MLNKAQSKEVERVRGRMKKLLDRWEAWNHRCGAFFPKDMAIKEILKEVAILDPKQSLPFVSFNSQLPEVREAVHIMLKDNWVKCIKTKEGE